MWFEEMGLNRDGFGVSINGSFTAALLPPKYI